MVPYEFSLGECKANQQDFSCSCSEVVSFSPVHERAAMKQAIVPVKERASREFRWERVTALSTAGLFVIALIALVGTVIQIKDNRETSRVQRLIEVEKEYESPEFAKIRRNLATERLDGAGH